jgi:hypothetical protein
VLGEERVDSGLHGRQLLMLDREVARIVQIERARRVVLQPERLAGTAELGRRIVRARDDFVEALGKTRFGPFLEVLGDLRLELGGDQGAVDRGLRDEQVRGMRT